MQGGAGEDGAFARRAYIAAVVALAAAALATAVWLALRDGVSPWMPGPLAAAFAGMCVAGVLTLQRSAIAFEAAGERLTISIEECLVFLMLLTLSPSMTPIVVTLATLGGQAASRRRMEKILFNVGTYGLAAAAAAATFAWLTGVLALPPLFGAFPALAVYSLGSNLAVAGLFALIERRPLPATYARRFLLPAVLQIGIGTSAGVALYGLWLHHPLATVAVLPFGLLARSYVTLAADANRKLGVHRRLAEVGRGLAGSRDLDGIAQRVLDTCGDVLQPGRIDLVLHAGRDGRELAWSRTFEGGPADSRPSLRAELPGPDGTPLGHIDVHPAQRNSVRFGQAERELARIVAGQAAVAFRNARALQELAEVKDLHHEIAENVPAGVVRVDAAGRIVQANGPMAALADEEGADVLVGRALWDLPVAAAQPALLGETAAMLEGTPFFDVEAHLPDGRTLSVSGVPLRPAEGGARPGGVVMFTDITARKQVEEAVRSQSLTRPFVRRLVLDLVGSAGATGQSVAEVGRRLAQEVAGGSPDDFAAAFRAMGLGDLRFLAKDGDTYTFEGDDLLTRRPKSRLPTCHMALGYVEGVIAAIGKGAALGSEVKCQSQGHRRCTFVVKSKPVAPVVVRRRTALPSGESLTAGPR